MSKFIVNQLWLQRCGKVVVITSGHNGSTDYPITAEDIGSHGVHKYTVNGRWLPNEESEYDLIIPVVSTDTSFGKIMAAIHKAHEQYEDDLCWMDIDLIFAAAGLPIPDRKLCSKQKQLKSCELFVNYLCSGGSGRKSYRELEEEVKSLRGYYEYAEGLEKQHKAVIDENTNLGRQLAKLVEENARLLKTHQVTPTIDSLIREENARTNQWIDTAIRSEFNQLAIENSQLKIRIHVLEAENKALKAASPSE